MWSYSQHYIRSMRVLTSNNAGYDDDGQDEEQEEDGLGPASAVAIGEVLPHDVPR